LYVYGLAAIPVSTARTITGGSYVVLALFSLLFLKTPLRAAEWAAVVLVSGGIVMIGLGEPTGAAGPVQPLASLVQVGMAIAILLVACAGLLQLRRIGSRSLLRGMAWTLVAYAAVSGLLLSVGDLLMKVILIVFQGTLETGSRLLLVTACGFGLAAFYLAGFYMLSRAYQSGGVVGGMVISDFSARIGAIFLGAMALAEPLGIAGGAGLLKAAGLLVVLIGSLLLGRFSGMPEIKNPEKRPAPQ
jgi:drug/metabolite transporter (DMT)-like permease